MIKSENGSVEIKGSQPLVLTDLTVIFKAMLQNGYTKEDLIMTVELSCKSKEELNEELNKRLDELFSKLSEVITNNN